MSVLPRAMVLAALVLVASSPLAYAAGDTCVAMRVQDYASGLSIVAQTGSVVALGFMSGAPGDGVGYVLYITPALCTGTSLPLGGPTAPDLYGTLSTIPKVVPLP